MNESIEQKLDKTMDLLETTIQQQSGHKSDVLDRLISLEKNFNLFKVELQPMMRAFNESENYKMVWTKTGISIKKKAVWFTAVAGALTILVLWIKWFIRQFLPI